MGETAMKDEKKNEPTLKEELHAAEAVLTDAEKQTLKRVKEELIAKWLMTGCVWGAILGALIGHFLLDTEWMTGIYSGVTVGLALGLAAGIIFGGLEKAMMLQHLGKYARPAAAEEQSAATAEQSTTAEECPAAATEQSTTAGEQPEK